MEIELEELQKMEDRLSEIYYNNIHMCGCGNPENIKKLFYDLMVNHELCDSSEKYDLMVKQRNEILKAVEPDVLFEFIFHILENAGLVEHGSSVHSSWLKDKGKEYCTIIKTLIDNGRKLN